MAKAVERYIRHLIFGCFFVYIWEVVHRQNLSHIVSHTIGFLLVCRQHKFLIKGLEPKLRYLALSMGENKALNLKDITLLKLSQDIVLLISTSSFV
jgi:hypothetical protein